MYPRSHCEVLPSLDAPDLGGESGEECALPAAAGSDLQYALAAREGERLDHGRDKRGLCRHLLVGNRERRVAFRVCGELGRDEVGPWNRGHRIEHARVGDAGERSGRSERVLGHAASMRRMKGVGPPSGWTALSQRVVQRFLCGAFDRSFRKVRPTFDMRPTKPPSDPREAVSLVESEPVVDEPVTEGELVRHPPR